MWLCVPMSSISQQIYDSLLKSYIKELLVNNEYNEQYISNRIALIVHYKNIGVPALTFVQFIDTLRHVLLQYIEKIPALSPVKESISSAIRQLLQFDLELCVDSQHGAFTR